MNNQEFDASLRRILVSIGQSRSKRLNSMLEPSLVHCDIDALTTTISFPVFEWEKNERGDLHGGMVSAMFDVAMGVTCVAFYPEVGVITTDMQVAFIKPFNSSEYWFKTELLSHGKTFARTRCVAIDPVTNIVVAASNGNYMAFKPGSTREMTPNADPETHNRSFKLHV